MSDDGLEKGGSLSEGEKITNLSKVLIKKFLHVDQDLEILLVPDLIESLVSLAGKIGVERLTEYKTVLVEGASAYPFAWFLWSLSSRLQGAKGMSPLPAFAPYGTGRREKVSDDTAHRIAEDIERAKYPEPILVASDIVDTGETVQRLIEALEKTYSRKLKIDVAALSGGSILGVQNRSEAVQRRKWLEKHIENLFTESNSLLAEAVFSSLSYRTGFEKEVGFIHPKAVDLSSNAVVTAWINAMEYAAATVADDMLKRKDFP